MPVVTITGPSGLTRDAKKQLIEGALHALTETYQMPDDRVYIHEVPVRTSVTRRCSRSHTVNRGRSSRSPRGSTSRLLPRLASRPRPSAS